MAWTGESRCGQASRGDAGLARSGEVWRVQVWSGMASRGEAGLGWERNGVAGAARRGEARRGTARPGRAGRGVAGTAGTEITTREGAMMIRILMGWLAAGGAVVTGGLLYRYAHYLDARDADPVEDWCPWCHGSVDGVHGETHCAPLALVAEAERLLQRSVS